MIKLPDNLVYIKGKPSLYLYDLIANKKMLSITDILTVKKSFAPINEINIINRVVLPTSADRKSYITISQIFTVLHEYQGSYKNLINKDEFSKALDEEKQLFISDIIKLDGVVFNSYDMLKIIKWYEIVMKSKIAENLISEVQKFDK